MNSDLYNLCQLNDKRPGTIKQLSYLGASSLPSIDINHTSVVVQDHQFQYRQTHENPVDNPPHARPERGCTG